SERLAAVRLLAHAAWPMARPVLTKLFTEEPEQDLRLAAVRALAAHAAPEVPALLLQTWKSQTPAVRREVTEALLRQPERIRVLLDGLAAGRIKRGDLDAARTRQLVNHRQPEIRERAHKLLQAALPADRQKVLEQYQAALTMKADPRRGRDVFQKNCATCHRVARLGVDVGPDIADTRTKTPDAPLVGILKPHQAIDNNHVNYTLTTQKGQ